VSVISNRVLREFSDKEFRDGYVESRTQNMVAYQIRALRDQRNMSQKDLAGKLPKGTQSTVSRLEDPDYGKMSLTSLFDLASAYDVALVVRFCSHEDFLHQTSDLSPVALQVPSYDAGRVMTKLSRDNGNSAVKFPMLIANTAESATLPIGRLTVESGNVIHQIKVSGA